MRAYLLRVLGAALLSSLCETLLPDGAVKKFAAPMVGLIVIAAILLPAAELIGAGLPTDGLLPALAQSADADVYADKVLEEYVHRIEASIEAQGDVTATVTADDDYSITAVTLEGAADSRVILYITTELGVARSAITIRKA